MHREVGRGIGRGAGGLVDRGAPDGGGLRGRRSRRARSAGASGRSAKGGNGPRLMFITNSNSDWWNAVEKGMSDGGEEFGVRGRAAGATRASPTGQIRLLEDALSLPDVQGRGRLGAGGRVARHRRQDARACRRPARSSSRSTRTASPRQRRAGPTSARTTARPARSPARRPRRSGPRGARSVVFVGTASAANAIERRKGFFEGAGPKFTQARSLRGRRRRAAEPSPTSRRRSPSIPTSASSSGSGRTTPRGSPRRSASRPSFARRPPSSPSTSTSWPSTIWWRATIDATVCQNPYEMGYQGVRLLKALIEKDEKTVKEMLPDGATSSTPASAWSSPGRTHPSSRTGRQRPRHR